MSKVKIFLEGDADVNFISSYLNHLGQHIDKSDIIDLDGKDNLMHKTTDLEKYTDNGFLNLVIFDADEDFNARQRELIEFMKKYSVKFEYFILPNDKETGELEDLLCKIINPKHTSIFSCFDTYEGCIGTSNASYRTPNVKHKIYSYDYTLNSFKTKTKIDFSNSDQWDLNHSELDPLKTFFKTFL